MKKTEINFKRLPVGIVIILMFWLVIHFTWVKRIYCRDTLYGVRKINYLELIFVPKIVCLDNSVPEFIY